MGNESPQISAELCDGVKEALEGMPTPHATTVEELKTFIAGHEAYRQFIFYGNTGDLRFFWRGYLELRKSGLPLTDNILQGLDAIAKQALTTEKKPIRAPKRYVEKMNIVSTVRAVQRLYRKMSQSEAIRLVARNNGFKEANLKKIFYEMTRAPKQQSASAPDIDAAMRQWR